MKLLEGELQKLKESVVNFGRIPDKLAEFTRDIDVSRDLYANLLRRYKETSAREKMQGFGLRVVAYASLPASELPKKTLVLLLSSVAWLGVGAGLV